MSANTTRLLLGLLIGAALMWAFDHREEITAYVTHKEQVGGASKIWSGLKEIGIL